MTAKIITNIILIISLSVVQIALVSGLPAPAGNLNLALVVLIFILGFSGFNFAAWWAVGVGFLFEIFSFLPFGAFLIGLSLTVIIANWLLNYFFTNRSLYSFLALTGLATVIYGLIINFFVLIFVEQLTISHHLLLSHMIVLRSVGVTIPAEIMRVKASSTDISR